MDRGTVAQHCAINVSGMISVRVIERILPRNRGGWAG